VAQFTPLGPADLAHLGARFGLGAIRGARPIAAGTINSNYEVEAAAGHFFVRLNEGKQEVDVAWEARLVSDLARAGVVTPAPRPAADGRPYAVVADRFASVFPWLAGHHLAPAEVTVGHARTLGAALAALHLAGRDLPAATRRPSIYDHAHLVRRYDGFAASADPHLAAAITVLGEELAASAAAASVRAAATTGIIHGDLFRDNVLWQGEALIALLDFEQASGGSLAYDLAVCLNDWCWTGAPRLDLAAGLLAGYQGVRPLPAEDRAALPVEVRAAAARFTITRITDVYLARVDNPDKDFRDFLARCEAWRGPALGQLASTL
jgi:homoserine kinase type II